jgi:hypothetical protein
MIDQLVLATTLSRVQGQLEARGPENCRYELEIVTVLAGQVGRRTRSNFGKIDDNDDELIKSLADRAVEKEGYEWDSL